MRNGDYELILAPSTYPGRLYRGRYCYEHHFIYWKNTGNLIGADEIIHHTNGDRRDNRIENLELMNVKKHNKLHSKGVTMVELICTMCRGNFKRDERLVKYKKTIGQKDFYCTRSCASKHFGRGRSKHSQVA